MMRKFLLGGAACGLWSMAAYAAPVTAVDAAALLAQSHVVDQKCHVLSDAERDELMDFMARAEIALAGQLSVKQAQAAMAKGRAIGKTTSCSDSDRQLVTATLAMARKAQGAGATAPMPVMQPEPQPEQPPAAAGQEASAKPVAPPAAAPAAAVAAVEPEPPAKPEKPRKKPKPAAAPLKSASLEEPVKKSAKKPATGSLTRYASVAQRYYVELKCRSMSTGQVKRLYASVLSSHKAALAENNPAAVRAMLRSAEASAGSASCG